MSEEINENDLPYRSEYAKSARSSCKACKTNIEKSQLRLAAMVQSPMFDGKVPNWFHTKCFFTRNRPKTVGDIAHFEDLRWDDQEKLRSMVENVLKGGLTIGGKKQAKNESSTGTNLIDFRLEYAKSGGSTCGVCEEKIKKGEARAGKKEYESTRAKMYGPYDRWHHISCFAEKREDLEYFDSGEKMGGFMSLSADDQSNVKTKLPQMKRKASSENDGPSAKKANLQSDPIMNEKDKDQMRKQNKKMYYYRDQLERQLKKNELQDLLESNGQEVCSGIDSMLDRLSDIMTFGALEPCPECESGQLVYRSGAGYQCTGNISEWTRCQFRTSEPKRKPFVVPKTYRDEFDFLKLYKYKHQTRIMTVVQARSKTSSDEVDASRINNSKSKTIEKDTKEDTKEDIKNSSKGFLKKDLPKKMKMKLKGGAVVDEDSGLENKAHVYKRAETVYSVVLGAVSIQDDKNSYYKLQLLEHDKKPKWYVFRSWGRIGTTIGGNKVDVYLEKNEAMTSFKMHYEDKTGNRWSQRDTFKKLPGKFYPMDLDFGQDNEELKKLEVSKSTSKLDKAIQKLVTMIFDIESMKKAMIEFEIDLTKMPLGKLSRKQIESAYTILSEVQNLIKIDDCLHSQSSINTKLLDASNRFFTLIPHDFGLNKPPLLKNPEYIKLKLEMLNSLMDIEIAYSLLKSSAKDGVDPIDRHYKQLKTDITVLSKDSDEFKTIQKYTEQTHASTHSLYKLEIEEVFKVARDGEEKRFRPYMKLPNRSLLWHGSRTTNYAGILSKGLRIAPPEAPVTGYMFGKGLYFADMVSKSANYCCTSRSNNTGLLLLCDVALGNMYERTSAEYIEVPPPGKHSTKGVGKTEPDPSDCAEIDGIHVPLGKGVKKELESDLLYNEYIVYDVAQVQAKYLVQMKFKYVT